MSEGTTKGKTAGSISRYASLGGGRKTREEPPTAQTSSDLDSQTFERSHVQTPKRSDVSEPERLNAQTSERSDVAFSKQSDAQTSKRLRRTVYLERDLDRWIRHRIADTNEQISDVINEAVRKLIG